ncbi:MAG: hypothetical protein ACRCZF_06945, partial [Gemmataceae bacterium]
MPASTSRVNYWLLIPKAIASLRMTVILFALSLFLVFFGTLAQMNAGIWTVVDQYFWSEYVWIDAQLLIQFGQIFFDFPKDWSTKFAFPFIGGRLLGLLMLTNLLAAHALRFQFHWKKIGIWIIHSGMILLFVGEGITRTAQIEQRMMIRDGESVPFSEDSRSYELAFVSPGQEPGADQHIVIPATRLTPG